MGYTSIYQLGYLEPSEDVGAADILMDQNRFQAIETQLLALYQIFGNGVLTTDPTNPSWALSAVPGDSSGQFVQISAGQGHVGWNSCATTSVTTLTLTFPPGVSPPYQFWIYATTNTNTPTLQSVTFIASSVIINDTNNYVCLGNVVVTTNIGSLGYTVVPSTDGIVNISMFSTLASIINAHVHIGGLNNPSPIDLSSNVQNKLDGSYITNLDASTVTKGVFSPTILPQISHTSLSRVGTLTHPQIDSLLANLQAPEGLRLSDITIANLMKLAIAVKRQGYTSIDSDLINTILYTPGVTPHSYIAYYQEDSGDFSDVQSPYIQNSLTLATIDDANKKVYGVAANPPTPTTMTWDTDADFNFVIENPPTISYVPITSHIVVNGTSNAATFTIDKPLNYKGLAGPNISSWLSGLHVINTSSAGITSVTPDTDNEFQNQYSVTNYLYTKFTSAVNLSVVQELGVGFGIVGGVPGDVNIYLIYSGGETVIFENSSGVTESISTTSPFLLQSESVPSIGRQYETIPISGFLNSSSISLSPSDLTSIDGIGFSWSTSTGWDGNEIEFYLTNPNVDEINNMVVSSEREALPDSSSIFVWNNNLYSPSASVFFRIYAHLSTTTYQNVLVTLAPAGINGALVDIQTRVNNSEAALATTQSYPLIGSTVSGNGNTGSIFDIIVSLTASADLLTAPSIDKIVLNYTSPGSGSNPGKTWSVSSDWNSGDTLKNIQVDSLSGDGYNHIELADTTTVGRWLYFKNNSAYQYSGTTEQIYQAGESLYLTPYQSWNNMPRGFINPRDMIVLDNKNTIIVDTTNDRVVELDTLGNMVRAIQGNLRMRMVQRDFVVLSAIYNPTVNTPNGTLWLSFSQNVTVTNASFMSIGCGQQSISFVSTTTDTVNVVPFMQINNNASTIQVTFSVNQTQTINNWTGPISVIISKGAVTSTGPSTDGTTVFTGSATTVIDYSQCGTVSTSNPQGLPSFLISPSPLYNLLTGFGSSAGSLGCSPGLLSDVVGNGTDVGDFNGNGNNSDSDLMGPDKSVDPAVIPVYKGNVIFDNIFSPMSIQADSFDNWLVASAGANTVNYYNSAGTSLWTIPASVVSLQDGLGGNAYLLNNGTVMVASPANPSDTTNNGHVTFINVNANNLILSSPQMGGDVVKALPNVNQTLYWVLIDDRANNGKNSHVVQIDLTGKIYADWGRGTLIHPTGLLVLPNDQILISE